MFLELKNFLNVSTQNINEIDPQVNILVVEEANTNQANFLICYQLNSYLKNDQAVCLVAFSQTFTHYASIGKKLATDLSSYIQNNQFIFVNGLELLTNMNNGEIGNLDQICFMKKLFLKIKDLLTKFKSDQQKILILDDVSFLLSLGCNPLHISLFFNQLIKICDDDTNFQFMSLIHIIDDIDDEMMRLKMMLRRQHDVIVTVSPLKTGYCRDITGQITIEWMKENEGEFLPACHFQKKSHYKLTDRTCSVFPIGLSTVLV